MIDFKEEIKNYPPLDLERLIEEDKSMPDTIKNSIDLYNKALENFRTKSEDIAIIELKKAISLNPDFHEAINLLGLFYIYTKDYTKATETFKKVISAENSCIKALEYLKEINAEFELPYKKQEKVKESEKNIKKLSNKDAGLEELINIKEYGVNDLIKIAAGFVAGGILVFILSYAIYSNKNDTNVQMDNSVLTQSNEELEQYKRNYNKLEEDYTNLNTRLKEMENDYNHYLNISRLIAVEGKLLDEKYEEAADMLLKIENVNFSEVEKHKYNTLYNDVINKAAWRVFRQGRDLLEEKIYEEAVEKFIKVESYVEGWEHSHYNLFYIGVCFENLNDNQKAIEYFRKTIDKYPSSEGARLSKGRLRNLENNS
ncbi:UNVERIFIED_CONTAM: hypothetical protein Cloal_3906 [Acetivibrio alkalicellulosi]